MLEMYFLCPTIFFIFATIFPLAISAKLPQGIQFDIGHIHVEDIRKMSSENLKYLRKKVMIYFGLAFIITLLISLLFYTFTDTTSTVALILCNILCLIIGLSTIGLPMRKITRTLKQNINE